MTIYQIPVEWDVLAAASDSCLAGYAPGFVNYQVIKQTPASATYRLWQDELGELGTVEIRKLRVGLSEIHFSGLPLLAEESKQQRVRKEAHLKDVQKAYFNRLEQEQIWKESATVDKDSENDSDGLKEVFDAIDKAAAETQRVKKRRESIPGYKPVTERLNKMLKSPYAVDRAIVSGIPFPSVFEMAKKFESESVDSPSVTDTAPVEAAQIGAGKSQIRCPKKGSKKHNDWKAIWRKVKGSWHGGNNYQQLAKLAKVSEETIADIVKAGDAGLLE
jgi:hypothetical protein